MGRFADTNTGDLFAALARPAATPGSLSCAKECSAVMSQALKDCPLDRYEVAARMSRLLGEEITKSMLDTWTAESKDEHIPNYLRAIAFDAAIESDALLNFFASKRGRRALDGEDSLLTELGRMEQMRDQLSGQIKAVREHLKRKT